MPSGQSGRTLWNVPKPSNRFQVLRATGQPPTITPLCVSCAIGLPVQQSKHRHFSSKRERARFQNASLLTAKIFAYVYNIHLSFALFQIHTESRPSPLTEIFKCLSDYSEGVSLTNLIGVQAEMQFASLSTRNSASLKFLLVFLLHRKHRPPGWSISILRKTGRWSWAIPLTLMEITQELPG